MDADRKHAIQLLLDLADEAHARGYEAVERAAIKEIRVKGGRIPRPKPVQSAESSTPLRAIPKSA